MRNYQKILFIFICLHPFYLFGQNKAFNPPPSFNKSKKQTSFSFSKPTYAHHYYIIDSLIGYYPGDYNHSRLSIFTNNLKTKIEEELSNGKNLFEVNFRGYADGIPNRKTKMWQDVPKSSCSEGKSGPIDDKDLAYIRSCLIRERFQNISGLNFFPRTFLLEAIDEPDFIGKIGSQYRKVVVTAVFNN